MSLHIFNKIKMILIAFLFFTATSKSGENNSALKDTKDIDINKIIIVRKKRNNYLSDSVIKHAIPFKEGGTFSQKHNFIVKNLYEIGKPFSFFEQVIVLDKLVGPNLIDLYVVTYEKPEPIDWIISGNKVFATHEIKTKLNTDDIHAISERDLKKIERQIKKMYLEKDFHSVEIDINLENKEDNKSVISIAITENKKSLIKRVLFKGNDNISSKRLRQIIFTREDWVLGFLDKSGSFRPEHVETDKRYVENYYKSHGFLTAKVTNVDVCTNEKGQYNITFNILEGDIYNVSEVHIEGGSEIFSEEIFLDGIPLKAGQLYSAKDIRDSIEGLKSVCGLYGYVFADIEPMIIPDEQNKTVAVTFNIELGGKVHVNRINILGNKKTRSGVIRRKLLVEEGDLLTTTKMEQSKDRVGLLGYFSQQNGVNWKINRLDDDLVDLDLIVNEVKTGRFGINLGVGGAPNMQALTKSFRFGGTISDTNLFGEGLQFKAGFEWSPQEWTIGLNVADPWFMHKPIYADLDFAITRDSPASDLKHVSDFSQNIITASTGMGFSTAPRSWLGEWTSVTKFGIEDISLRNRIVVNDASLEAGNTLRRILNNRFQSGNMVVLQGKLIKDERNSSLHPSKGIQEKFNYKIGLNAGKGRLGFAKFENDFTWYTPLIDENRLVLGIHTFIGGIVTLGDNAIPYRELYHIGGPASVRGYLFGQVGPTFLGDSIGSKMAFFVNTELVFPLTPDFRIKGAVFWDGGAGWNTPDICLIPENERHLLKNNKFEFRQAVGIGVRMLQPTPLTIDLGFKLNRQKDESPYELHFSMKRDF